MKSIPLHLKLSYRVKSLAIQVLKNCAKVSDYERMLAQNNALEMTLNLVPKQTK
jgi:hypothetical protein